MFSLLLKSITVFVVVTSLVAKASAFSVLATMYSDGGESAGGAKLNAYPTTIKLGSRSVRVFPIAMYSDRITSWKYKVIKLRNKNNGRIAYGHVVDECASGSCHANRWLARKRGSVLVDVHKTMWRSLGLSKYGIHALEGQLAAHKRFTLKNSPGVRAVMSSDAKHNYLPNKWKV